MITIYIDWFEQEIYKEDELDQLKEEFKNGNLESDSSFYHYLNTSYSAADIYNMTEEAKQEIFQNYIEDNFSNYLEDNFERIEL